MPRESFPVQAARTRQIIAGLQCAYPDVHCELHHSNPLELLVATILSAQCTDKQVNVVTADLFQKYRTPQDFALATQEQLENDLRRINFFRNKAKNIRASCQKLLAVHGGVVPRSMAELTALDGVGRKTANVVLGNAFGINVGVVVDTHVARLAQRLGLTRATTPKKIEPELMQIVPPEQWTLFSYWLIWHGRRCCSARKPDCAACRIAKLCPSAGRTRQALVEN